MPIVMWYCDAGAGFRHQSKQQICCADVLSDTKSSAIDGVGGARRFTMRQWRARTPAAAHATAALAPCTRAASVAAVGVALYS